MVSYLEILSILEHKWALCSQMGLVDRRIPYRSSEKRRPSNFPHHWPLDTSSRKKRRVSLLDKVRLTATQHIRRSRAPVTECWRTRARSLSCAGSLPPLRVEAYPCAFFFANPGNVPSLDHRFSMLVNLQIENRTRLV